MQNRESAARTYYHACREAKFALVVWFAALVWTVGYCYLRGYKHEPDSILVEWGLATSRGPENFSPVFGVPDWIVYGVIAPWVVCTLITIVYGLLVMNDDDLGAEPKDLSERAGEEAGHGH